MCDELGPVLKYLSYRFSNVKVLLNGLLLFSTVILKVASE